VGENQFWCLIGYAIAALRRFPFCWSKPSQVKLSAQNFIGWNIISPIYARHWRGSGN